MALQAPHPPPWPSPARGEGRCGAPAVTASGPGRLPGRLRTGQVGRVAELNQQTGELIKRGVVLVDSGGPTYLFTRLNDIKPELLVLATRNARAAAEQFAADSGSAIAEIRRASQGLFEILARDPAPNLFEPNQLEKKIRVVSTVEYRLTR